MIYLKGLNGVKIAISSIKSTASNNKSLKAPIPFSFKKVVLISFTKYLTITAKHQNSKVVKILNPGKCQVLLR